MGDGPGGSEKTARPWGTVYLRPPRVFRAGRSEGGGAKPVETETSTPVGELAAMRARQRVPDERAYDFELAVNEVAINAIERAGGGTFLMWEGPDALVCEVFDGGPARAGESLVNEGPVAPSSSTVDHDFWFVGQLVDGFEVRARPERISVRLWITVSRPTESAA